MADSQSMTPESDDILARERAGGTYSYQWRQFARWCEERVRQFLPASTEDIADYLKARYAGGARPSTLRVISAAIARVHLDAGYENPCAGELSSDIADWYERGIPILSLLRDYVRLSAKGKCPPRNLLCYQTTIWSTSVEMAT